MWGIVIVGETGPSGKIRMCRIVIVAKTSPKRGITTWDIVITAETGQLRRNNDVRHPYCGESEPRRVAKKKEAPRPPLFYKAPACWQKATA